MCLKLADCRRESGVAGGESVPVTLAREATGLGGSGGGEARGGHRVGSVRW